MFPFTERALTILFFFSTAELEGNHQKLDCGVGPCLHLQGFHFGHPMFDPQPNGVIPKNNLSPIWLRLRESPTLVHSRNPEGAFLTEQQEKGSWVSLRCWKGNRRVEAACFVALKENNTEHHMGDPLAKTHPCAPRHGFARRTMEIGSVFGFPFGATYSGVHQTFGSKLKKADFDHRLFNGR